MNNQKYTSKNISLKFLENSLDFFSFLLPNGRKNEKEEKRDSKLVLVVIDDFVTCGRLNLMDNNNTAPVEQKAIFVFFSAERVSLLFFPFSHI